MSAGTRKLEVTVTEVVEVEGAGGPFGSGELNTRHNGEVLAGRDRGGKRDFTAGGCGLALADVLARKAGNHFP